MKKIAIFALSASLILLLGGCSFSGGSTNTSTDNAKSAPPQNDKVSAENNSITIQDFTFNPGTLTVKKGAVVTWTNNDSVPHQIKSDMFNSGVLTKGQSFSFTFDKPGTFSYSCAIHPSMLGEIIVQ